MLGRMMVSALALMSVAQAQNATAQTPAAPAGSAPAPAPSSSSSDRTVYEAAFFTQFHPQNANDMVQQVPGFSLNGGDDRRGFSGAVGNLLIDGERPITKSQSLSGILSRIPANQVVRIEVWRGALVAGDASGQAVLVNVVRTPTAGSGNWDAGNEFNRHSGPQGDISWSGRAGHTEYGIGASYYSQFRSLPGYRNQFDANSVLTGHVDTPSPRDYRELSINGNYATQIFGGRLSTTEQLDAWRSHSLNSLNFFTPSGVNTENFVSNYTERQWSYEVGANYVRDYGPWEMTLVGLLNRRYYDNLELDHDRTGGGGFLSDINATTNRDSGETILRGTLARDFGHAHHLEFGIEGAYNTLDASLDFIEDDGSGPAPLLVPNSNVTVAEKRAEAFVAYTWRPNDRWSVETKLAREQSTLTFTGDSNQSVDLAYVKPSIQVSRNFGTNNQFRVRLYRDVGQLNFDNFVSAASVVDNLINGGNPDLKPQTDWRLDLGGDLHLPLGIAVSFTYTRHRISDAQDLVQIIVPGANPGDPPIRFDAPGNIGDATGNQFVTNDTIPFEWMLHGSKLTITTSYYQITVTDPVTGHKRDASGQSNFCTNGEFRDDMNAHHLAWGFDFQRCVESQTVRFNETDTDEEGPYVDWFVETTMIPGIKARATLANSLNPAVRRQRLFYSPDRNGPLDHYEERQRNFDHAPWLLLSVSGTF